MLARIRQSAKTENDQGFTLIELLVVMIIIGILAAIAIPVFLNQRKKAQDTATKSDVTTIGKEIATYFVDNTAAPAAAHHGRNAGSQYTFNGAADIVGRVSPATIIDRRRRATTPHPDHRLVHRADRTRRAAAPRSWKYSAADGLQSGALPAASPAPTTDPSLSTRDAGGASGRRPRRAFTARQPPIEPLERLPCRQCSSPSAPSSACSWAASSTS